CPRRCTGRGTTPRGLWVGGSRRSRRPPGRRAGRRAVAERPEPGGAARPRRGLGSRRRVGAAAQLRSPTRGRGGDPANARQHRDSRDPRGGGASGRPPGHQRALPPAARRFLPPFRRVVASKVRRGGAPARPPVNRARRSEPGAGSRRAVGPLGLAPAGADRVNLELRGVEGLPEIRPGDDLAALIVANAGTLRNGDVIVVAQKVVSKAGGRIRTLSQVTPSSEAIVLAQRLEADARMGQVVL